MALKIVRQGDVERRSGKDSAELGIKRATLNWLVISLRM